MVGWHHRINGHEFEPTSGESEGQGSLACCSPWGSQRIGHNLATQQQQPYIYQHFPMSQRLKQFQGIHFQILTSLLHSSKIHQPEKMPFFPITDESRSFPICVLLQSRTQDTISKHNVWKLKHSNMIQILLQCWLVPNSLLTTKLKEHQNF